MKTKKTNKNQYSKPLNVSTTTISDQAIRLPSSYSWLNPPVHFSSLHTYLSYLKKQTRKTLALNQRITQTIRAIVVPHAGLQYSGLCSMSAYLPASYNKTIKTLFLLHPLITTIMTNQVYTQKTFTI